MSETNAILDHARLKSHVHSQLLKILDLSVMERLSSDDLRVELSGAVKRIVNDERITLDPSDLGQLVLNIQNEVMGLGPIEPLIADPTVSDILVNGPMSIYVERYGRLEPTSVRFSNHDHVLRIIEKIVSRVGRRIDESSPMVDARLPDGSRVNAIIPPLALDGPVLSIRRFSVTPFGIKELIDHGTLSADMASVIESLVRYKTNVLISGGTGSGKTTLLNVLSSFVPADERIITIEDAAELRLQQPHVVRLETRPANVEGKGEISQRSLVKNSLRMRPDRIVVGEVRGAEVLDMLQAMNTGHQGSMTTIHANSPRDAMIRLENMVSLAGIKVGIHPIRRQIASAINVVIQVARLSDGTRKVLSVQEITGMEGDMIEMQEIFSYEQHGLSAEGRVNGAFVASGIRPRFAEHIAREGYQLPDHLFVPPVQ
ncbi:MAG: CpaF family protein [Burkholderiaceae bacterium]|nr:CpaF family protein [Burkholderiaceae bacterium]